MTRPSCITCRYAQRPDPGDYESIGELNDLECRRHPPMVVGACERMAVSYWPMVNAFDWCGEHEPERE